MSPGDYFLLAAMAAQVAGIVYFSSEIIRSFFVD